MNRVPEKEKLVVIGDLHGRDIWARIVLKEPNSTREIFVGDYFDSWDVPFEEQEHNFRNILDYKRQNPERVVLLLGNHDYQYIPGIKQRYSGYQEENAYAIGVLVEDAIEEGLIQACYERSGFLFSHAGITKTWLTNNGANLSEDNIPIFVNSLFRNAPGNFRYDPIDESGVGENKAQGPFWVRPTSLKLDGIEGYRQVVGHTPQKSLVPMKGYPIFVDVFDKTRQYLVIEDGKPLVKSLV